MENVYSVHIMLGDSRGREMEFVRFPFLIYRECFIHSIYNVNMMNNIVCMLLIHQLWILIWTAVYIHSHAWYVTLYFIFQYVLLVEMRVSLCFNSWVCITTYLYLLTFSTLGSSTFWKSIMCYILKISSLEISIHYL